MKEQVYSGYARTEAFEAIAEDLKAMALMIRAACAGRYKRGGIPYIDGIAFWTREFMNLASYKTSSTWQQIITDRTNNLLREIHLTLQLPLWKYTVVAKAYAGPGRIEVWREVHE